MQRILFRKVELWVVILVVLAGLLGAIWFACEVRQAAARIRPAGTPETAALAIAEIPETVRILTTSVEPLAVAGGDRHGGAGGWTRSAPVNDPGTAFAGPSAEVRALMEPGALDRVRFRTMHPLLTESGELLTHGQTTPTVALDPCGRQLWQTDSLTYHHSLNEDADGNIWSAARVSGGDTFTIADGTHGTLAEISPEGKVIRSKPVPDILDENDMDYLVYNACERTIDPLHLSDVEPVLKDGPYWRRGALFLSLRNVSTILLYRPSTGEVIWSKTGPRVNQHDVDVLDDHRISVFNNNIRDRGNGGRIEGASHMTVYDFRDGSMTTPLAEAENKARILSVSNRLADRTESGDTILEEDSSGRLRIFGPDGALLATAPRTAGSAAWVGAAMSERPRATRRWRQWRA